MSVVPPDRTRLAIAVMVATTLTMSLGDALVKAVSTEFSLWQVYVLRSVFAVPLVVLLIRLRAASLLPRSGRWVALRCLLLMLMWIAFYAALADLSLSAVAAAYYTAPLLITLFAAVLLREPVGLRRWIAMVIGFAGVLAILRPGTEAFSWLGLLPVLAAAFYAGAAVVTRVKCADEDPLVLSLALNLAFLLVGAAATALVAVWIPPEAAAGDPFLLGGWTGMGLREWAIIALLGVLIVAVSTGFAMAYQSGAPATIAAFDYSYLAFAALWSIVFFAEVPDLVTIAGMALIAGAGVLAVTPVRVGRLRKAA